MNLLGNQFSYCAMYKGYEMRNKEQGKRIFGKDITNLDRKTKNSSIGQKVNKLEGKRSRSLNGKRQNQVIKDPITEYENQIIKYLVVQQTIQKNEQQKEISQKMRQILIDWLVDVHQSFELKQQTLYLSISYLNIYSSKCQITKQEYQLVGITCLWIASKYQEIYPPRMHSYIEITADTYTIDDLKKMESKVLAALDFNLNIVTTLHLLQSSTFNFPPAAICLSKYMLETSLLENLGKKYTPVVMVLAALSLSNSVYKNKTDFVKLKDQANISKQHILICFRQMCKLLQTGNKYHLKALKRKFLKDRYHGVSKIRIQAK